MPLSAHRGEFLHFVDDPSVREEGAWQHLEDGLLLIEDGFVVSLQPAEDALAELPASTPLTRHENGLIVPGLIDTHIHYPQCEVIAAYGTQLLDWLQTHTFPAEARFADRAYADEIAAFFLNQLIANGTTTALVFGTVHATSVDAFFDAALARNMRMIAGKVMMDRNAPDSLTDTAQSAFDDSNALIRKWHGRQRLGYAVTPRFAPTSTANQLDMASRLLHDNPGVHLHTHLSENTDECAWVAELFPERVSYLDVYDHHQLLGQRSVFAHCLHLGDADWQRLAATGSAVAHCPLSNMFIGSGLFPYRKAMANRVDVGLGTDVGGGDNFSLLRVINEAYKVQQLQGENLSPFQSLYLATLGGARALDLDGSIGNFLPGREADFIVLDYAATPLIDFRIRHCRDLLERLFVLEMLGDDRTIRQTFIMGEAAKR